MSTLEQKVLIELLAGEISGEVRLDKTELQAADWEEVLKEAKAQAVPLMAAEAVVKYRDFISNYSDWENVAFVYHSLNVRAAYDEQQLNAIMKDRPFFILKGMAAASYYPKPHQRILGDIDFLIDPIQRSEIESLLSQNGYKSWDRDHICHVVFRKGEARLEMHFEISGIPYGKSGETVREFMTGAVNHSETAQFDAWSFPVPEDIYHGLIILLYMQHHMLEEGLGLRHICDWACYLKRTENKPFWQELLDLFREIGIFEYAQVISKICSMYFHINCPKWAESADEELCEDVMGDVLSGGNFGVKDTLRSSSRMMFLEDVKSGKKRSKLVNLFLLLHNTTPEKYPIVKKYPVLYPFFECRRAAVYFIRSLKGERNSFAKLIPAANQRKSIYDRLHIFETDNNKQ